MEEKKRNSLFTDELLKASLQLIVFLVIFIIFFNLGLDKKVNLQFITNEYFREKIKDNIILIITGVLYFLVLNIISNVAKFITNPINLHISFEDLHDRDDHTTLYHFDDRENDFQSGVKVTLEIYKSNSFWNFVALRALENKNIEILISVYPRDGSGISCLPDSISDDYKIHKSDFGINISELLISNLKKDVPFRKEHIFLVEENRDKPVTSPGAYPIKPVIYINEAEMGFYYSRLINMRSNLERGYYPIKFALSGTKKGK